MKNKAFAILITTCMVLSLIAVPVSAAEKSGLQKVNGEWVYMTNGEVNGKFTGLAKNANGWWYVNNGKVDFSYNGLAKNANGWWKITRGKVDFGYTGFETNSKGTWYVEKGKITFKTEGVFKGKVNGETAWWYVKNSKVNTNYTGPAKNVNGWWYIKNGKVDFTYTGFTSNAKGNWLAEKGKIKMTTTTLRKGTVEGYAATWYVKNSKVQTSYSGVKKFNGSWYNISQGRTFSGYRLYTRENGENTHVGYVSSNNNSFPQWFLKDGKVDTSYTGAARASYNDVYSSEYDTYIFEWYFVNGRAEMCILADYPENTSGYTEKNLVIDLNTKVCHYSTCSEVHKIPVKDRWTVKIYEGSKNKMGRGTVNSKVFTPAIGGTELCPICSGN